MRKFIPYIAVAVIILIATVVYVQKTDKNVPVLSADLNVLNSGDEETQETPSEEETFKNYGPAPELTGITKWLNSDAQTIAGLKGQVVLVNFWNYSSIHSVKAFPYLNKWSKDYKEAGLTIIGVHTPEFAFEKVSGNLENAMKAHNVSYSVAQDNNYKTWQAYHNQFWPAYYLIDRDGNLVFTHFGEGQYNEMEKAMRILLGLEGQYTTPPLEESNQANTPEIHLGLVRQNGFGNTEKAETTEQIFTFPEKLGDNKFALEGRWRFNQEAAVHTDGFGRIKLNFDAAKVFLVAESSKPTNLKIYVDGKLVKGVVVEDSDLYQLFDSIAGGEHTMEIEIPHGEFKAYTFTFG